MYIAARKAEPTVETTCLPDAKPVLEPLNRCELCHDNHFESLAHRDRRGQPLETVVCRRCGLVSHAQLPDEESLRHYYGDRYRREYNCEQTPSAYRVLREWRRGRELLKKLRGYLPAGSRVFEVGSGIGCTIKQFELAGFQARGVEPGCGFYRFSRERLKATVQLGVLEDLAGDRTEDLVLLVHVLEHLPRPSLALRRIHGLLKPGGLLYVEVPNFGLPHAAPGRIFHFAHIYNFTHATLVGLARAAGFELLHAFPGTRSKNLMLLFRAVNRPLPNAFDASGYTSAIQAVGRSPSWRYYLRGSYLVDRACGLARRLAERLTARWQLRQIADRCNRSPAPSPPAPPSPPAVARTALRLSSPGPERPMGQ